MDVEAVKKHIEWLEYLVEEYVRAEKSPAARAEYLPYMRGRMVEQLRLIDNAVLVRQLAT